MKSRDDVVFIRNHWPIAGAGPACYKTVTGFFIGANWANPEFLKKFQYFVGVRIAGMYSLVWGTALAFHVLGVDRGSAVLRHQGTEEENERAIKALFDAVDQYLACEEAGGVPEMEADYKRAREAETEQIRATVRRNAQSSDN